MSRLSPCLRVSVANSPRPTATGGLPQRGPWRWRLALLLGLAALGFGDAKRGWGQTGSLVHSDLTSYRGEDGARHRIQSAGDWERRRKEILDGMQQAMGPLPDRAGLPPFDLKVLETSTGPGYRREKIEFTVEPGDRLPADIYWPEGFDPQQPRPAILALHPTGAAGKRIVAGEGGRTDREYGLELAQRGYVVLAPDYPSFGDYKTYDFHADRYDSGTMKGIFNHMRCVDLLSTQFPGVDPARIGVIGHSLGGHNAMFVAAFDPRLKVIVASCGWTPFHDYYAGNVKGWTSDRYMPRIRDVYGLDPDRLPFDFYEVVAALAPRPFFSCSPLHDANFDVKGIQKAIPKSRTVYALFHAEENLQVRHPDCEHDFPKEVREEAYEFIDQALRFTPNKTP